MASSWSSATHTQNSQKRKNDDLQKGMLKERRLDSFFSAGPIRKAVTRVKSSIAHTFKKSELPIDVIEISDTESNANDQERVQLISDEDEVIIIDDSDGESTISRGKGKDITVNKIGTKTVKIKTKGKGKAIINVGNTKGGKMSKAQKNERKAVAKVVDTCDHEVIEIDESDDAMDICSKEVSDINRKAEKGKEKAEGNPLNKNTDSRENNDDKITDVNVFALDDYSVPSEVPAEKVKRGRLILEELMQQLTNTINNHEILQKIARSPNLPDLKRIQLISDASRKILHMPTLPHSDPFWSSLPDSVIQLLSHISQHPLTASLDSWIANGTLIESHPTDAPPTNTMTYYLRQAQFKNTAHAIACFSRYAADYPADIPFAIACLHSLGADLADLEDRLCNLFAQKKLDPTIINKLFASLPPSSSQISPDTPISAYYAGLTGSVAPNMRAAQDLLMQICTRFTNFCKSNPLVKFKTYHISTLDQSLPLNTNLQCLDQRTLDTYEITTISCLGSFSLNSAHGGSMVYYDKDFDPAIQPFLRICKMSSPPLPGVLDNSLELHIRIYVHDEKKTMQSLGIDSQMAPSALQSTILHSSAANLQHGHCAVVRVLKDITLQSWKGQTDGFWDAKTGRALREHLQFDLMGQQLVRTSDAPLKITDIAGYFGPTIDFWPVTLEHASPRLCYLYLCRKFTAFQPLFIASQSSIVSGFISSSCVQQLLAEVKDERDRLRFLAGVTTDSFRDQFSGGHGVPLQHRGDEFMNSVGTLSIVQYGLGHRNLSIHIPTFHNGLLKYDPCLEDLLCTIQTLVQIIIAYCVQCAQQGNIYEKLQKTKTAEDAWKVMKTFLIYLRDRLDSNGLAPALYEAKHKVYRRSTVLHQLRTLTSPTTITRTTSSSPWAEHHRPHIFNKAIGAPNSDERIKQLVAIQQHNKLLVDGMALNCDPFDIGWYDAEIGSDRFRMGFLKLGEGTDLRRSANSKGRTKEGAAVKQKIFTNMKEYNAAGRNPSKQKAPLEENAEKEIQKRSQTVTDIVVKLSKPSHHATFSQALSDRTQAAKFENIPRIGTCIRCNTITVSDSKKNHKHYCLEATLEKDEIVELREEKTSFFPLERLLYPHDILEIPQYRALIPRVDSFIAENLVICSARDIANNLLQVSLPPSFSGNIYIHREFSDDVHLKQAMAVDLAFKTCSTLTQTRLIEPRFKLSSQLWRDDGREILETMREQLQPTNHIVYCRCESGWSKVFATDTVDLRQNKFNLPKHRSTECATTTKAPHCKTIECTAEVRSIHDLPPDAARRIAFSHFHDPPTGPNDPPRGNVLQWTQPLGKIDFSTIGFTKK